MTKNESGITKAILTAALLMLCAGSASAYSIRTSAHDVMSGADYRDRVHDRVSILKESIEAKKEMISHKTELVVLSHGPNRDDIRDWVATIGIDRDAFRAHLRERIRMKLQRFRDWLQDRREWWESKKNPPAPVPVPAALWLFGSALAGLFGFASLRRK